MKSFMNSLGMWTPAMAATAILTLFSATSLAQTTSQSTVDEGVVQKFEDVEELLDDVEQYDGRRIQVSGEVEEKIDDHSFILESGGFFNDEIPVLMPEKSMAIKEDSDVTVTGVVRTDDIDEIGREYGWNVSPEIKADLEKVKAFLIAEKIVQNEDD
jgi:hypothetical protein